MGSIENVYVLSRSDNSQAIDTIEFRNGDLKFDRAQPKIAKIGRVNSFPDQIIELVNLKELYCEHSCRIESLPPSLGQLKNLEKLTLKLERIVGLPEELGNLVNLKELSLILCCKIEVLPPSIGRLKKLEIIFLENMWMLRKLPEEIGGLLNLKKLTLGQDHVVESLRGSIGKLKKLEKVDLTLKKSFELPEEFGELTNLRELTLKSESYRIEALPRPIGRLKNLEILNLGGYVGEFSEAVLQDIGNWFPSKLKTLKIDRFRCMPSSHEHIRKLKGLMTLHMYGFTPREELKDFLIKSIRSCPKLGAIELDWICRFDEEVTRRIESMLAFNRARFRIKNVQAKLWPRLLANPKLLYSRYAGAQRLCSFGDNPYAHVMREEVVYRILVDNCEFLSILISRLPKRQKLNPGL